MQLTVKHSIYGLILAAFTLYAGCKKTEETTPEPTVTFSVLSPTEGAAIAHGDTLQISATVSSDVELHGYEWKLRSKTDNTELASGESHTHSEQQTVTGTYVNSVSSTTQAELEITVVIDHEGTEKQHKINITLNQ